MCVKPTWLNSRWCCTAPTSPPMGSCSDSSSSLAVSHSMISWRDSWSFPLLSEKASSRTLPTQQTTARQRARTHGQNLDSTEIKALKNRPNLESRDILLRNLVTISFSLFLRVLQCYSLVNRPTLLDNSICFRCSTGLLYTV